MLKNSAVAITDGVISEIGDFEEMRRKFPDVSLIGTPTSIVTPGYINAHQHLTGDRYLRSAIPDTISSNDAIFKWIVPLHELLTATDDRLSATAGLVEALSNGVTFTVEAGTVAHPHEVARAFVDVGARGTVGRWGRRVGVRGWVFDGFLKERCGNLRKKKKGYALHGKSQYFIGYTKAGPGTSLYGRTTQADTRAAPRFVRRAQRING